MEINSAWIHISLFIEICQTTNMYGIECYTKWWSNKYLCCYRETTLQGGLALAKSGRLRLEKIFCRHYRSIFNHCDVISLQSCWIQWKTQYKELLCRSRSFKVIKVGTNRKPVCNFLLMINSNWYPISYCFEVYCWNFGHFAFLSHHLGAKGQHMMFIVGSLEST